MEIFKICPSGEREREGDDVKRSRKGHRRRRTMNAMMSTTVLIKENTILSWKNIFFSLSHWCDFKALSDKLKRIFVSDKLHTTTLITF